MFIYNGPSGEVAEFDVFGDAVAFGLRSAEAFTVTFCGLGTVATYSPAAGLTVSLWNACTVEDADDIGMRASIARAELRNERILFAGW